jgi:hypothetical protein
MLPSLEIFEMAELGFWGSPQFQIKEQNKSI